jgi:hypothetical protein
MSEAMTNHDIKVLLEFSGVPQDEVYNDAATAKAIKALKELGYLSQGFSCYITNEGKEYLNDITRSSL